MYICMYYRDRVQNYDMVATYRHMHMLYSHMEPWGAFGRKVGVAHVCILRRPRDPESHTADVHTWLRDPPSPRMMCAALCIQYTPIHIYNVYIYMYMSTYLQVYHH